MIWPKIRHCSFDVVVDLAAGHGRNSRKLLEHARKLFIVDVNEENVSFCRSRFANQPNVTVFRNNGYSLRPIEDETVSLLYCFDAMVHFDSDVIRNYLKTRLVGAAISIFFLLLVSLSEHLSFGAAYAAAATECVVLLGYYASHMLQSWKRGLPFGAGIATLYGLLYLLLQLEQKALVVGAIALFLVLAFVMLLTRKVDWYAQLQLQGASRTPT